MHLRKGINLRLRNAHGVKIQDEEFNTRNLLSTGFAMYFISSYYLNHLSCFLANLNIYHNK